MLEIIVDYVKDLSVLRKLLFAATWLPTDLPNKWGIAVEFATAGKVKRNAIDPTIANGIVENIEGFDACALKKRCLPSKRATRMDTIICNKTIGNCYD